MRVGFAGLGVMGRPMARFVSGRLRSTGGTLVLLERDRTRVGEEFPDADWAADPSDLGRRCDLVVLVVPSIVEIRALVLGDDGIAAEASGPLTVVVCSTTSPDDVRTLAADVAGASHPVRIVDSPVSGGAEGAEAGTLSIMVGGADADVAPVLDVLSAAGTPTHLGPLGAGQVAKACNQLVVAAEVTALAEASLLAERAGLDVAAMFDVLGRGYAASRVLEVKKARFANHDHSPSGPAKFMIKDLTAAVGEAERTGLRLVTAETLLSAFTELTEAGLGDYDTAVMQRFIESRSEEWPRP